MAVYGDPDTVLGITAFVLEMGMVPKYILTGTKSEEFTKRGEALFAKFGAVIATGSLCDESGGWGVEKGRGVNLPLTPLHVKETEVVVLWGRNPAVTNSHMLPALKGKTVAVIDPVKTMEHAHLHLPLRPRGDLYLALLLSRIAYMEMLEDKGFIAERTEGFEEFKVKIGKFEGF